MATHYKLLFRGAIHKDQHASVVRGRLQTMLKASEAQLDVMFSGKPVTIKKVVDEATAERFLDAFVKAGAKLELIEVAAPVAAPEQAPSAEAAPPAASPSVSLAAKPTAKPTQRQTPAPEPAIAAAAGQGAAAAGGLQLAEAGADLVPASAQAPEAVSTVPTDHLSLAVPGTNLGQGAAATEAPPPPVDTAHLQLDQPGVRLGVPAPVPTELESLMALDFELGEVGEVLVASKPTIEVELPSVSHLELESQPVEEPDAGQPA